MIEKLLPLVVIIGCSLLIILGIAYADYDDDDDDDHHRSSRTTVPPVTNVLYAEECGACHFAYQPGWLPARSWKKMMGELDNHFGDNAELDPQPQNAITHYLTTEAADQINNRKSHKMLRSIGSNDAPQRISTLPYFVHEHDEIPQRLIKGNLQVKSVINCQACHTQAEAGDFDENSIKIPGYGRWDD